MINYYSTIATCKKCGNELKFENEAERIHYICSKCYSGETSYIISFSKEYFFLSNFYVAPFIYHNEKWLTSEHFYQGMKTGDLTWRKKIQDAKTAREAKVLGLQCPLREDSDLVKNEIMMQGLMCKFAQNRDIRQRLIDTGDAVLIEGNNWGDRYWGVDKVGENILGKLLMKLRGELNEV